MFIDPDYAEIEPENEHDFIISDILNEKTMTIKMVLITNQVIQNEEITKLKKKNEKLEEVNKKILNDKEIGELQKF